jgi:FkbM family methyltransferase
VALTVLFLLLERFHLVLRQHSDAPLAAFLLQGGLRAGIAPSPFPPPPPQQPPPQQQQQLLPPPPPRDLRAGSELPPRPAWASSLLDAGPFASFSRVSDSVAPGTGGFWVAREDAGHASDEVLNVELQLVDFFLARLKAAKARDGGRCRALDVGSNGGFFSLLSRAMGCEVLAIDAQPRCLERLESAAALNGFSSGLATVWAAVGEGGGDVNVGATRCSGLWAIKGAEWVDAESERNATVAVVPLALAAAPFFSGPRVAAMKIDTEGSEVAVLRGALPLLEARRVDVFVAEFSPWRTADITPFGVVQETLTRVYDAGYSCSENGLGNPKSLAELVGFFDTNLMPLGTISNFLCELSPQS